MAADPEIIGEMAFQSCCCQEIRGFSKWCRKLVFECDHFCPTMAVLALLAISGMQRTASACHSLMDITTNCDEVVIKMVSKL